MSDEEDCGAWVQFSQVGINARMRDAMELFARRSQKEAAPAVEGIKTAGALTSKTNEGKTIDGDKIVLMRKVSR